MEISKESPNTMIKLYPEFHPHFGGRIRDASLRKLQSGDLLHLIVARTSMGKAVGFSCILLIDRKEVGITVVKKEWRNQGIGTKLLRKRYNINPKALSRVSEENISSKRMCEKVGLRVVATESFLTETTKRYLTILVYKMER